MLPLLLLVAGTVPARAGKPQVARALSSEGIDIRSVLDHQFADLDGDGVNEALVHGRGNLRGASLGESLGINFHTPRVDAEGHRLLLPSTLAWGRFVGVFGFDRHSFRWKPLLIGTYRREKGWVTALGVVQIAGETMIQVGFEEAGTIWERLYRLGEEGMEEVFSSRRGTWMGEGFLVKGPKLLVTRGLPNPFAPGGRPGFLARIRYRWRGGRFDPEYWKFWGQSFRPDWTPDQVRGGQSHAFRTLARIQEETDRELDTPRLDLERLAASRFDGSDVRVVYQKGGYGVVVVRVNREELAHFFVQPYFEYLGEGRAAWIALDELEAPGEAP